MARPGAAWQAWRRGRGMAKQKSKQQPVTVTVRSTKMANLRDELLKVRDKHGVLTPDTLLKEAKRKNHPLHDRFEWDDETAAHKYRIEQAHELIQKVKMEYVDGKGRETSIRSFHAVRTDSGFVYEPAEEIAADPVLTKLVLLDMQREWQSLQARYGHFQEFVDMVQADLRKSRRKAS